MKETQKLYDSERDFADEFFNMAVQLYPEYPED